MRKILILLSLQCLLSFSIAQIATSQMARTLILNHILMPPDSISNSCIIDSADYSLILKGKVQYDKNDSGFIESYQDTLLSNKWLWVGKMEKKFLYKEVYYFENLIIEFNDSNLITGRVDSSGTFEPILSCPFYFLDNEKKILKIPCSNGIETDVWRLLVLKNNFFIMKNYGIDPNTRERTTSYNWNLFVKINNTN